jgi:hypothetical protein
VAFRPLSFPQRDETGNPLRLRANVITGAGSTLNRKTNIVYNRKECSIMKLAKCLMKDAVTRAAFLLLPFFLTFSSADAKESTSRGARHLRAAIYFQGRPQSDASHSYTRTRSPGWKDETES